MQIYFGKATPEIIEATDYNGLFISQNNDEHFFTYGIDFGGMASDEIAIYDGLDRRVPIHLDHLDDLMSALKTVQSYLESVKSAQALTDNVSSTNFSISI